MAAVVSSAAIGAALPAPASAALPAAPSRTRSASDAIVQRIERLIGPWEKPEDVFAAVYRSGLTPAAAGPEAWPGQAPQAQAQNVQGTLTFDIAPGPLSVGLQQFAALTRITVRVAPELVRALTNPAVRGTLTPGQALAQLLSDSRLSHRFVDATTVIVEIEATREDVTVSASLPAVSSPKFTAPIVQTPQTITVVSRNVIESQGATNLRDVLRNVPGITMQAGEGGGGLPGDTLTMRGFSASGDIYVDGVRDVAPYSRDAFNLEQVEVIKGPSSSFGGRGSTGGAINLATKTPQLRSLRRATAGLGGADFRRGTLDMNEPFTALGSPAAARVNVMWQDAGVPGRQVVENESWAVAPSVAFGMDGATRVTLSSQHLRQRNVPDYGLPWGTYTDPATGQVYPTGAFNATPAVDQSNFYGLANYDFEHIDNDMATVRVEHDVRPGLTLRNLSRYGQTERDHAITAPRPPNRQLQRRFMENDALANQTSVSWNGRTAGLAHAIAGGLEVAREETATKNSAQTTNQPQVTLQSPDPRQSPFGPMPDITGNPSETRTSTVGVYLFDTVDLGARWQATGGLRWDRSDVDYRLTTLATGAVTALERVDRMLSGRAGIVFRPTTGSSIYAGYGTSFNPSSDAGTVGAALGATDTSANSVNLKPEKSRNVEVGTKWSAYGDRLLVTGAVFDTEKTNARTRNLSSDPFVLAGRQRVRGVELGVSGQILPGWTALAGFSQLDSKIVDSANDVEDGRDLALTPSRTASLWTTWEVRRGLSVGGGAQYMDAVFRNTTTDLKVPSYWLVNAMASYGVNRYLTLRVNGTNLGDERYVDRVGGGHYIPGPRRTVQVTADFGF
ncbi:MAG: TonB-dependent siderophore receptor [Acidobacteria bacterium]|nr:TonB-dependent siderophore receptor [Acidobacteriota bacterium]